MKKILYVLASFAVFLPGLAFAAGTGGGQDFGTILSMFGGLIHAAIPILMALAVLFFFFGLAMFILKSGDEEGRKKGMNIMIWGIVALFVMVSIWGLVSILQNSIGAKGSAQTTQVTGGIGNLVPHE